MTGPWRLVDSAGIPAADDIRLDGHLDVCEDVLALNPTYLHGGNRFQFLTDKTAGTRAFAGRRLVLGRLLAAIGL